MGEFVLLCRLLLAWVFAVSGTAKLLDRSGTKQAVTAFGVPERAVVPVAAVLPWVELLVCVLLLPPATGRAASVASLALLLLFSAAVTWNLAHGRHPTCRCFGKIGSSDVSGRTLMRNAVLAAAAAVGAAGSAASLLPGDGGTGRAVALLLLAAALAGALLVLEASASARAQRRRDAAAQQTYEQGLTRDDQPAPDFRLTDREGRETTLAGLLAPGLPCVLVFMSPGCGPCRALNPAVVRWASAYSDRLRIAVLLAGSPEAAQEHYAGADDLAVLIDAGAAVRSAYGMSYTPSAVLVDSAGRLASPPAIGEGLIRRLLAAALSGTRFEVESVPCQDGLPVASLTLGSTPAPRDTVTAHDLDGTVVLVDEASGASVALDAIGDLVWRCLDGTSSLDEITADLATEFRAPVDVVSRDVLELTRSLGRSGMLRDVAAEWPESEVDHVGGQADDQELAASR